MPSRRVRRAAFWTTVAGVSILSNFGMELLADKAPSAGLRRFTDYLHRGPGSTA